jgi:hypothetical protein
MKKEVVRLKMTDDTARSCLGSLGQPHQRQFILLVSTGPGPATGMGKAIKMLVQIRLKNLNLSMGTLFPIL